MPPRQREDSGSAPGWSLDVSRTTASTALIAARGEFDVAAVTDVHRVIAVTAAALTPPATVVMDLSAVTFLDAAMLGALVTDRRALRENGGDLQLTGVGPWATRIIEICGLRATLGL